MRSNILFFEHSIANALMMKFDVIFSINKYRKKDVYYIVTLTYVIGQPVWLTIQSVLTQSFPNPHIPILHT